MWPFTPRKPKQPKPKSPNTIRIEELQALAPLGHTFKYMGVGCTVVSNYGCSYNMEFGSSYWPEIEYQYVDNMGVIRNETLSYTIAKQVLVASSTADNN